ncbi:MAG TPA: hypothetical protein VLT60_08555 [Usitatibacter sp.]|nr:hypothetical protein [Usitatibacter sp.]
MRSWSWAALLAALLAGCAAVPSPPDPALDEAVSDLLQADAAAALAALDRVDPAHVTAKRRTVIDCVRARFAGGSAPNDLPPVSSALLEAYQRYWREAMLKRVPREKAEEGLLASLRAMPALAGAKDASSLDSLTDYAVTAIEREGLHALTGKTEPLYELMIWKSEETRIYDVQLPENPVKVKVVFLDRFASAGWAGYATCGVAQTGGWAKPDALYAVRSSYDLDSENFRVSYLAHEGQHFSDYGRYPALEQPELEYRAKLTEIALSKDTTAELLERFASQGGTSRDSPHAFADRQVTLALKGVPMDGVREAAAAKLRESSATIERLGAKTTKRFLPD